MKYIYQSTYREEHPRKRLLLLAALLVAAAQFGASQMQDKSAQPAADKVSMASAEQAVNRRVSAFLDALRKGDEAVLASIYGDDFTVNDRHQRRADEAQRLQWVKANASRLSTLNFQNLKTRVYDDTAIVTGRATSTGDEINSRIIQCGSSRATGGG